jgi:FtsZ-binding cell division protein ZapB
VVVEYDSLTQDYQVKFQSLDEKFVSKLRDIQAAISPDAVYGCKCEELKKELNALQAERDELKTQNEKLSQWVKKLVDELEKQRPLSKFPSDDSAATKEPQSPTRRAATPHRRSPPNSPKAGDEVRSPASPRGNQPMSPVSRQVVSPRSPTPSTPKTPLRLESPTKAGSSVRRRSLAEI